MPDHRLTLWEILKQYAVVLAAPFVLLAPLLLRGHALFWGTPSLQFVPWWVQAWESLRQGALPLWNPLNGMGAPLLANYQTAFFYPPNWLLLPLVALGGAAGAAWGLTLLAALHLAWAGLGMSLFLRRLNFPWLGQVIGGLAFGLSGYAVGRLGFFSMAWVYAWLPWVLLLADPLAVLPARSAVPARLLARQVAGLAVGIAMPLLAGHAQLSWYSLLLAAAWMGFRAWGCGGWRAVLPAWARFGAAGLLAAGLAAVQLVPTFEYLRHSFRADQVDVETAMTYSFWPWRFITLFSPDFYGSPASGDYWGYATYWEDHAYTGLLPLLLALATLGLLGRGLRRSRGEPRWALAAFAWAVIAAVFVLALGKNTPVFPFLYQYVPTFDMFQAPARFLILYALLLPLLAAVGLERWHCPERRALYWLRLGTAGAFAVTLGAGLALILLPDVHATFIRATALTGMWALGAGLLTLAIPWIQRRGWTRAWQWAVIAWTAADLLLAGWSLNPGVPLDFYRGESPSKPAVDQAAGDQRLYLGFWTEYDLKFTRFLRFEDYTPQEDWRGMRAVYLPNLNLLDGVPVTNNFDPLVPDSYARWMDAVEELEPERQEGWLALAGVGAVERIDPGQPGGVRFDTIAGAGRWRWYSCVLPAQDGDAAWEALRASMMGGGSPLAPPVVEGAPEHLTGNCLEGTKVASITRVKERPGYLELGLAPPGDGWLYLADTWYPGWRAWVDGVETPILRANGNFRAVQVEAGSRQVVLRYLPSGFIFGGMFSILVLLLIVRIWTWRGTERV